MKNLGAQVAEQIDWSGPRLICVASDFTRYDEYAIAQINRSIELVRYRDYDGAYLTLDLVSSTSATATAAGADEASKPSRRSADKTVSQLYEQAPDDLRNLYDALEAYLLSLGDDVTKTTTFRPGLRPEGVALRAVRLTGRDEPGTVGGWLMTSPAGIGIC